MAISMAIDLGINKPPKQAAGANRTNFLDAQFLTHYQLTPSKPAEAEGKRAFLGCYYLSSA